MSKIEKELNEATGVSRVKGQDEQVYLKSLAVAGSKLGEAEYDALSEKAADWITAAATAINEAKAAGEDPVIEGFGAAAPAAEPEVEEETEESDAEEASDEEPAEDEETEEEEEPEEEPAPAPKKKDKEKPVAKEKPTKPAKAEKPAKAAKPEKPKRKMASKVIRVLCIKYPRKTEDEIRTLATAEVGGKINEVTFRGHFLNAHYILKTIKSMGLQITKVPKPDAE